MFCDRGYTDLGTRGYLGGRVIIQYTKHPETTLFNNHASKINNNPFSKMILNNHFKSFPIENILKINNNPVLKSTIILY